MFHSLWGRPLRVTQMAVPCVRPPLPESDSLVPDSARLSQPPACGERGKPRNRADFQRNGVFERSGQPNVNRFRRVCVQGPSGSVPVPAGKQPEVLAAASGCPACFRRDKLGAGTGGNSELCGARHDRNRQKQARVCGAAATVRRDVMRYDLWRRNCRRSATIGLQPSLAWKGRVIFSKLPQPSLGA